MLPVHTKGPLTVLPSFIQPASQWGDIPVGHEVCGACLILQVAYIVEAVTRIDAQDLVRPFRSRRVSDYGVTLSDLAAIYTKQSGKQIGARRHATIGRAIAAMKQGRTIVGVTNSHDNIQPYENGYVPDDVILTARGPEEGSYRHSLLLVGADQQEQTVVFRESRPQYTCYGGLMKISQSRLERNREAMAYIEVVVH